MFYSSQAVNGKHDRNIYVWMEMFSTGGGVFFILVSTARTDHAEAKLKYVFHY